MPKISDTQTHTETSHCLHALKIIHALTATFNSNPEAVYDQIVLAIADKLKTPLTMIHEFDDGIICLGIRVYKGQLSHTQDTHHCTACLRMTESTGITQCVYTSKGQSVNASCFPHDEFQSFLGVPIIDHDGLLVGVVCTFDADKRKFSDNEIDFVEILARVLAKEFALRRSIADENRPFKHSSFTQLASGVSNEVRNRLNAMFVNTEALFLNIDADSELRIFQGHIRKQVTSLATLMGDLMALAMPIGKGHFFEESIYSLVLETFLYWRQSLQGNIRKVNITMHCSEYLIILVDGKRLRQAFFNLLMNAHNHSPVDGELWLTVSEVQNQWVLIRVQNSGAKISSEQLSQAFEPYSSIGKSCTGLSLSIVKQIIEYHGGEVSIFNNTPPPGFTIELKLPLTNNPEVKIQTSE